MSVFTPVSESELRAFLAQYDQGELRDYRGIEEGIENSNFFVSTTAGEFVLTLFERTPAADLPYFLGVMEHLSAAGIPSARPMHGRDGAVLRELNGRAAALVERLDGRGAMQPSPAQCAALGQTLARMHRAGADFDGHRPNCRGPAWWRGCAEALQGHLPQAQQRLLDEEIAHQAAVDDAGLPGGVIHADLFRDNALFDGERLSGLIDFYYACNDSWLYDLAVCVNDWVINPSGVFDEAAYRALLQAYAGERAFTPAEQDLWRDKLRAAALRFWVSRLYDWHFPRPGELTYRKDPAEFERILRQHRAQPPALEF